MFTNQDLKKLIIPLFLEQLLVALVGIADVLLSDLSERRRFPVCHWSMRSKGRLKLPENDPLFLTTEKLLGKGILGKRDYFGAMKIMPGYGKWTPKNSKRGRDRR